MSSFKILSKARKAVFDGVPNLSAADRKGLMMQNKETKLIIRNLRSKENKVGFLVQRAYFQSKGRFFKTEQFKKVDIKEAEKSLGLRIPCDITKYNEKTAATHRQIIRAQHGWSPFTSDAKTNLETLALINSREQMQMEDMLFSLLEYCWRNKIEIPSYNVLEGIVVDAFEKFIQNTLVEIDKYITEKQRSALLAFINHHEIAASLSKFKRIDQAINLSTLNENAKVLQLFRDTFFEVLPLLEKLALSNQAIKQFSQWIYNSNLTQIRQFKNIRLLILRLLCFVRDQFYLRQDYAIDALLKTLRGTVNKARGHDQKQREYLQDKIHEANQAVLYSAKNANGVIRIIGEISKNDALPLFERNEKVINLVENYFEAVDPSFNDHVTRMEKQLEITSLHSNFYDYLFSASGSLTKTLCPLIKSLVFDDESTNSELLEAIDAFNTDSFKIDETTPLAFLKNKYLHAYERDDDVPKITKYKVILLSQIDASIRDRTLTLKYSYRFVSDQYFLIPDSDWKKNKEEIIFATNLSHFSNGESVLEKKVESLPLRINFLTKIYLIMILSSLTKIMVGEQNEMTLTIVHQNSYQNL